MASNDYKNFYLRDLMEMIDQSTIEVIRNTDDEIGKSDSCNMQIRLQGIFDLADELKSRLNEPEVE